MYKLLFIMWGVAPHPTGEHYANKIIINNNSMLRYMITNIFFRRPAKGV